MTSSQPSLFSRPLDAVVNVASVRQLSPFRYPGGKTWLIPRIRQWLHGNRPLHFIEPFAGGGIVSLTVAAENLADRVTMVERDEQIAAVWKCIFTDGDAEWLAENIVNFEMTLDNLNDELATPPNNTRRRALQTILKNRTYHGGILAAGSGVLKFGEKGKGILSRWYPETLRKRILAIAELRDRIAFIEGDAFEVISAERETSGAAFFVDPPYTAGGKKAGRRLYTYFDVPHEQLFTDLADVNADVLMTYDDSSEVRKLAESHSFVYELVAMKNTHHAEMKELLIGRRLDWLN